MFPDKWVPVSRMPPLYTARTKGAIFQGDDEAKISANNEEAENTGEEGSRDCVLGVPSSENDGRQPPDEGVLQEFVPIWIPSPD